MSTLEQNAALLSTLPEDELQQIHECWGSDFCKENPYKSKTKKDIYEDLAKSRESYENGDYQDADDVIAEVSEVYGILV